MELSLTSSSQRLARQIQNRINEHFGNGKQIADAKSPTRIVVEAPPAWTNNEEHFFELVMHLPLAARRSSSPALPKSSLGWLRNPPPPRRTLCWCWRRWASRLSVSCRASMPTRTVRFATMRHERGCACVTARQWMLSPARPATQPAPTASRRGRTGEGLRRGCRADPPA